MPGCSSLAKAFTSRITFSRATSLREPETAFEQHRQNRLDRIGAAPPPPPPVGQPDPLDGVVAVVHFVARLEDHAEAPAAEALHGLKVRQVPEERRVRTHDHTRSPSELGG